MEAITALDAGSDDFVRGKLGSYVWNNYFHAFATTGARSVAVFLWFLHTVVILSMFDTYSQLNNFHRQATVTQA
jgi:hypothetical protein